MDHRKNSRIFKWLHGWMIEDILAAKKSIVIRVVRRGMATDYCLSLTLKWLWREGGNILHSKENAK